ncbi:MAG: hypothetical protein V9G10_15740 [Candidatus Nanopelagicales bacterium]
MACKTTVVDDRMQRAPVFILDDARGARDLAAWIEEHLSQISAAAESTTSVGRLIEIERYHVGPHAVLALRLHDW